MFRHITFVASVPVLALACGCASTGQPHVVAVATPAEQSVMLDQVKSLSGTWELVDDKGARQPGVTYSVFANGSAVREVMFPGSPHEMTNIYHMDGSSLVVTHYCAQGNQPRMRCQAAKKGELPFVFDSVTNMTAPGQPYMGQLTLVLVDANTLQQKWKTMNPPADHPAEMVFTLKRKG